MANYAIFDALKRLFSNDVIIRNVGGNQLKIIDTDRIQSAGNIATNRFADKYSRVFNTASPSMAFNQGLIQQAFRLQMFQDYEIMDTDSILASALDIYADESCIKNEFGNVLTIKSSNERVSKVLNNLFYDVLNIEFNLWPWIRGLCKYGDFFVHLHLADKYGVIGCTPLSSYEIIREEQSDPTNPNYVHFRRDLSGLGSRQYSMQPLGDKFENYEMAHFRLINDTNFLPYGRSMIEPARKVWKQVTLMEDAMLINRIMRAPSKRVFKVDIGNIPPNEVDNYMEQLIAKTKKIPYVDEQTGEYNLRFNLQNMIEDYYLPVRGSDSGTAIETLEGIDFTGIDDIEYLKDRMLAALRVPKSFLSYEADLSGKATLAALDMRFARTIERIQRIVVSELSKIALVHLWMQGFRDEELVDFELSLTNPSIIFQQEKIALWTSKMDLANSMIESKMFPRDWIYEHVWDLTEDEYIQMKENLVTDSKTTFRLTQIEEEGNDPVKTGRSFGTQHDIASLYKTQDGGNDEKSIDVNDLGGSELGGQPGAGRPSNPVSYATAKHPLGRDPIGSKELKGKFMDQIIRSLDKRNAINETFDISKNSQNNDSPEQLEELFRQFESKIDETAKVANTYK